MTTPPQLPLAVSGRTAEDVIREAAAYAGRIQLEYFRGDNLGAHEKGRDDVVSDVDIAIERDLRALLTGEFPDTGFLGEETGESPGASDFMWTVDPIDGTANFVRGIPHFATTIALLHRGAPVLGITYDPIRDDTFFAQSGKGFTLNGATITPHYSETLQDATLGFDIGPEQDLNVRAFSIIQALLPMHRVRLLGSGALGFAYAAAGLVDVYFHLSLKPWDVAAGLLFIQETTADATAIDFNGARATPNSVSYLAGATNLLARIRQP